ncbi:MAG: DUF1573 domain-containing protein [Muribaculaceae bacterium]
MSNRSNILRRAGMALLAALMCLTAFADDKGEAAITLASKSYDFGNIRESAGPVTTEFEFVNTGDAPLVIISAVASCGCTRPVYPQAPVKPGKSGKIKVTFLPQGRPGEFSKTIKVRTNAKKNKKFTLRISGVVIPKD